ncbi:hypothetical protein BAMA_10470 [Bacillus manliponensis]|uniref:Uncharacterized protein n=1 Tax=Bacillus manliponensis TaxID=574376 RepID=A0A073JUD5_9BACI|nr:hypothetical protein [Bacillus manliponensis]KEK17900.1 hypothetical protein BAMA_10470 [Bacillus manliponensis]
MKKFSLTLITMIACLLVFGSFTTNQAETLKTDREIREERIATVLEDAWEKYDLSSFQIGVTDPTIWVEIEEIEHKKELITYLEKNISKSDLNHYKIDVFEKDTITESN